MHPIVFNTFQELLSKRSFSGPILEVGALPSPYGLLNLPVLAGMPGKTGINLSNPVQYPDYEILKCNAHDMRIFSDDHFGLVLCNAMLEHDKFFWRSIAEIRRVTRPGGLVMIGTPGYTESNFRRFKNRFRKRRFYRKLVANTFFDRMLSSTSTFEIHGHGYGDYYRFSPMAFREVFFEGFQAVEIVSVMNPPRIIGIGIKS